MTKILIDRATAEQTLEALDSENPDIQLKAALALRTVLEQQQAKPVQEPPQYSVKAHWTDDKRIGVVACVTRPDGGVHLMQTIIDLPPEQEDAFEGWVKIDEVRKHFDSVGCGTIYQHGGEGRVPLYTAPPQREWVGLTDEEIFRADPRIGTSDSNVNPYQILINARTIEAKLKEKNHG